MSDVVDLSPAVDFQAVTIYLPREAVRMKINRQVTDKARPTK